MIPTGDMLAKLREKAVRFYYRSPTAAHYDWIEHGNTTETDDRVDADVRDLARLLFEVYELGLHCDRVEGS